MNHGTAQDFGRPVEILLAEDSPTDAKLAEEAIAASSLAARIHHVSDGLAALAFLRQEGEYKSAPRPDLILLDLKMPRMDGLEVLEEIQDDERLSLIPVVALTTSSAEDEVSKAYRLGANCYVIKPIDFRQFMQSIESTLRFWCTIACLPPASG
ncbi:MAG: response regulator [Phycisphaerae bacterium]|nr:response regulator [Phycisphaerae bacterium]